MLTGEKKPPAMQGYVICLRDTRLLRKGSLIFERV